MILCQGQVITTHYLTLPVPTTSGDNGMQSLKEIEATHIRNVLASVGNNRSRAAKILGISRSTLNEKMKLLN